MQLQNSGLSAKCKSTSLTAPLVCISVPWNKQKKQPQSNIARVKVKKKNLYEKYKRAQDSHCRDFEQKPTAAGRLPPCPLQTCSSPVRWHPGDQEPSHFCSLNKGQARARTPSTPTPHLTSTWPCCFTLSTQKKKQCSPELPRRFALAPSC